MSGAFEGLAPYSVPRLHNLARSQEFSHGSHIFKGNVSATSCQKHWGQSHGLGDIVASHNEIKGSSWRALGYIVELSRARILVWQQCTHVILDWGQYRGHLSLLLELKYRLEVFVLFLHLSFGGKS